MVKTKFIIFIFINFLILFFACNSTKMKKVENTISCLSVNSDEFIKINYDFKNLKLYLNSSINDSTSKLHWNWSYLISDNTAGPDKNGLEYYHNHEQQPIFKFNDEETLPSLSIKTCNNKIILFGVTIIFHLENKDDIPKLLNSLTNIDLLNNQNIRQKIIEKGKYELIKSNFKERLELIFAKKEHQYDRIEYSIELL